MEDKYPFKPPTMIIYSTLWNGFSTAKIFSLERNRTLTKEPHIDYGSYPFLVWGAVSRTNELTDIRTIESIREELFPPFYEGKNKKLNQ